MNPNEAKLIELLQSDATDEDIARSAIVAGLGLLEFSRLLRQHRSATLAEAKEAWVIASGHPTVTRYLEDVRSALESYFDENPD